MALQDSGRAYVLRCVSVVMAAFCSLASVALSLMLIFMVVGYSYGVVTQKPFSWNKGAASISMRSAQTCGTGACTAKAMLIEPKVAAIVASAAIGGATPAAALAYGLAQASLCFVGFARGRFLDRRAVSRLMRFAGSGLIFVITSPFSDKLAHWTGVVVDSAFRMLSRDPSTTIVSASFKLDGFQSTLTIIYAVTLTVTAVIMVKASAIADDHAQIV